MAILSMTGFGKAEGLFRGRKFTVELRTVNGRFLETTIRLPREFSSLEGNVRLRLQERIQRGTLQCLVQLSGAESASAAPQSLDLEQAKRYLGFQKELCGEFGDLAPLGVRDLLSLPGVLRSDDSSLSDEELWKLFLPVLDQAIEKLREHRAAEGENLRKELLGRLRRLEGLLDEVEKELPERMKTTQERLRKSIAELVEGRDVDENRMEQEIALLVDKLDVTEEIVRFRSHNKLFEQALAAGGPQGKKLGFLLQEMGREANTLGTKSQFATMQHLAIALKEELEIIREQTMNVE